MSDYVYTEQTVREILIPEFFIIAFLLLALLRPWVKKLSAVSGIIWLPLAAFLLSLGLFPAYGFRPEALPLVICATVTAFLHVPLMFPGFFGAISERRSMELKDLIIGTASMIFLIFSIVMVLMFSPAEITHNENTASYQMEFRNETTKKTYSVKILTGADEQGKRPLIIIPSPVFGRQAVERLCIELEKKGFAVLSFSPKKGRVSELIKYVLASGSGKKTVSANTAGRILEIQKSGEIIFILNRIHGNPKIDEEKNLFDIVSMDQIFICSFDASATAAMLLANRSSFAASYTEVKGIIAAEAPLWSLYEHEKPAVTEKEAEETGRFKNLLKKIGNWMSGFFPKKIDRLGRIPEMKLPSLLLVSDRFLEKGARAATYKAIASCFSAAQKNSVLVAAAGMGPFDYAGFSSGYPVVSALYGGRKKNPDKSSRAINKDELTAMIIANFAHQVLDSEKPEEPDDIKMQESELQLTPLPSNIHIETRSGQGFGSRNFSIMGLQ